MDDDPPLRRWAPVVFVVVACVIVILGLGAAVYVAHTTAPATAPAASAPRHTTPRPLTGHACIALGVVAVGSPATSSGAGYRLRIAATDSRSCVLRPSQVALVAQQSDGSKRVFAVPASAIMVGPTLRVDYTVRFPAGCAAGHKTASVLLSIGGAQLLVPGASIPAGLANCGHVRMTAAITR